MEFSIQVKVSSKECIPPYEHVHHAEALKLMELAREKYLDSIGYPLSSFLEKGLFLVVTEINAKYLREIKVGNYIVTCSNPIEIGKAIKLQQKILNEKSKVCIEADVSYKMLSKELQRAVEMPMDFRKSFLAI